MHFTLKRPCPDCPFLKVGGIRLTVARATEIAHAMLDSQGATFACHNTTVTDDETGETYAGPDSQHCAGALIFSEQQGKANQMVRIAERLRLYDARLLMADPAIVASVFGSEREMLAAQWEAE